MKSLKDIEVGAVAYVTLTDLVPGRWAHWFYGSLSEGAPFSWGDNDRTLVTASRVAEHCDAIDTSEGETDDPSFETAWAEFKELLVSLGERYIDLEN